MCSDRPAGDITCLAAIGAAAWILAFAQCTPPKEAAFDAGIKNGPTVVAREPVAEAQDVPINKVIRITFSDHLDTRSLTQSRISLFTGPLSIWPRFYYNPVRKQLVAWPTRNMRRNMLWILRFEEGVYDIEGNPTAPGPLTHFYTGNYAAPQEPYRTTSFSQDILPIFQTKCASCHGGAEGTEIARLRLDSAASVNATAIGQTAGGWPDWQIIESADPGRSYLLFKLIGDHRIAGLPMPRALDWSDSYNPLTEQEQNTVAEWIASGTPLSEP